MNAGQNQNLRAPLRRALRGPSWVLAVVWLLVALPAHAVFGDLFGRLSAEVWTVDGEGILFRDIEFRTPDDFDAVAPNAPLYEFTAGPETPDFAKVQRIVLNSLNSEWQGSRPERLEVYRLGGVHRTVPPPPDWKRAYGQAPMWQRALATRNMSHLPFLNHAIFAWAPEGISQPDDPGVFLFRQPLRVDSPATVARATLRIATNAEPMQGAFNRHPLHLVGNRDFSIIEYEVTPLVRAGDNLLALMLREQPGRPQTDYGLAFHLEIVRRKEDAKAPPVNLNGALIQSEDADRIWGQITDIRGDRVTLETPYGPYRLDWDACTGLILPAGWAQARPLRRGGLFGGGEVRPAPKAYFGMPLGIKPGQLQDSLLLIQGQSRTAKPAYVVDDRLYYEGFEGRRYSIEMEQVLGIYPPRLVSWVFKRPKAEAALLYCQMTTTAGERISGLLRRMTASRVVLETVQGEILEFDPAWIGTIQFPYHATRIATSRNPPVVGLISQVSGQEAYRSRFSADARKVQSAAFAIGARSENLSLETLANAGALTPGAYPVVVTVDPVGEYIETLRQPGDAEDALLSYIDQGGVLIALSRGGAFRTAIRNQSGGLVRTVARPGLGGRLGLTTVRPGVEALGILPFAHPPNTAEQVYFQRSPQLPEGLQGLPRRILMAPMLSSPFYPMVAQGGQGMTLYSLQDTRAMTFGPALTLLPRGRGYVLIIDHLLWDSTIDDRPFTERALPILMRWAIDTTGR